MPQLAAQHAIASSAKRAMEVIWPGGIPAQAIYAAASLKVADVLGEETRTVADLAQEVGADGPALARLLRALVSIGLFCEDQGGSFRNSELSHMLRTDPPESVRPWALLMGDPLFWNPTGQLLHSVMTGVPAFDHLHGEPFFQYTSTHPEAAALFHRAMAVSSAQTIASIASVYDFSRFKKVIDVGGGRGALLTEILTRHPHVHGVLYDLPHASNAADGLRTGELAVRCEIDSGSFFDRIPSGGDAYILKGVLHGWQDSEARRILTNCRSVMQPNATLIVLETLLDGDPGRAMLDLFMMLLSKGKERTANEYSDLLFGAGFSVTRIIPTAWQSIIEARPSDTA